MADITYEIRDSIQSFHTEDLTNSSLRLLKTLGYHSGRVLEGFQLTSTNIAEVFHSGKTLHHERGKTRTIDAVYAQIDLSTQKSLCQIHTSEFLELSIGRVKKLFRKHIIRNLFSYPCTQIVRNLLAWLVTQ